MIVDHTINGLAIMCPPKCGSTSVHSAMSQISSCMVVSGMQITGDYGLHTHYIPAGWKLEEQDWMSFYCLTRHPYERAVSLYAHLQHQDKIYKNMSFETFVRQILMPGADLFLSPCIYGWYMAFQHQYSNIHIQPIKISEFSKVIKNRHGLQIKLPHLNQLNRHSLAELYTDKALELIQDWAFYDLQAFKYDKEPWW